MTTVKEYKGVKILVTDSGKFYCDVTNKSRDFEDATFKSEKLQSIEKAIDEYTPEEIDGNTYYAFGRYSPSITKIKVVKKVGNRCFFNDGTDTSYDERKKLYPENTNRYPQFETAKLLQEEYKETVRQIKELYSRQNHLMSKFQELKSLLPQLVTPY